MPDDLVDMNVPTSIVWTMDLAYALPIPVPAALSSSSNVRAYPGNRATGVLRAGAPSTNGWPTVRMRDRNYHQAIDPRKVVRIARAEGQPVRQGNRSDHRVVGPCVRLPARASKRRCNPAEYAFGAAHGREGIAEHMPDPWLDAFAAAGTCDQVAAALDRLAAAGADSIVLQPLNGDPACLDEYAEYVMPHLRSQPGAIVPRPLFGGAP